jgi:hypothetical protein
MSVSADRSIARLPHPIRVDAALGEPVDMLWLRDVARGVEIDAMLRDDSLSIEDLMNLLPGLPEQAHRHRHAKGCVNFGLTALMLARARLRAHGEPMIEVTERLEHGLSETDIAHGLPARYLRPPFPFCFIVFPVSTQLVLSNRESGLHRFEGTYVGRHEAPPGHRLHENSERAQALGLDPSRPTHVVEIVLTGSPEGKSGPLDDATNNLQLLFQHDDECLASILDRHDRYYSLRSARDPDYALPWRAEAQRITAAVTAVAKVLLYLGVPDARRVTHSPRTEIARQMKAVGPKKRAKLARKMATAYDRIIVGPPDNTDDASAEGADQLRRAGPAPHWRRGHFRHIAVGRGRKDREIRWFSPVLVNAQKLADRDPKARPYPIGETAGDSA